MTRKLFGRFAPVWLSLTATERRGYLFLGLLLALLMGVNYGLDFFTPPLRLLPPVVLPEEYTAGSESDIETLVAEWLPFDPNNVSEDTLILMGLPRNVAQNMVRYRERGGKFRRVGDVQRIYGMNDSLFAELQPFIVFGGDNSREEPVRSNIGNLAEVLSGLRLPEPDYFLFDPNTASMEELRLLGFDALQSRNLIAYREKGGSFVRAEDIMRIYGVEESDFLRLKPWINMGQRGEREVKGDVGLLDLNRSDSIALLALPGIGPVFAGRIVRYREQLGGYIEAAQLLEVYGMSRERYEGIVSRITVSEVPLRQIRLNFSGNTDMIRHPYIDATLARKIVAERSLGGAYETMTAFVDRMGLPEEVVTKISPYLTCE